MNRKAISKTDQAFERCHILHSDCLHSISRRSNCCGAEAAPARNLLRLTGVRSNSVLNLSASSGAFLRGKHGRKPIRNYGSDDDGSVLAFHGSPSSHVSAPIEPVRLGPTSDLVAFSGIGVPGVGVPCQLL